MWAKGLATDAAVAILPNYGTGGTTYNGAATSGSVFIRKHTPQAHPDSTCLDFNSAAMRVGRPQWSGRSQSAVRLLADCWQHIHSWCHQPACPHTAVPRRRWQPAASMLSILAVRPDTRTDEC
jgi:hypothetical protein